ncbi:MAG: DUF6035 family protein [Empedobacter falsenii]
MENVERTIKTVFNQDLGEFIEAEVFFKQTESVIWNYRKECQLAIQKKREPFLVCDTCGQLIQISGGKGELGKRTHFKHLKDSEDCPNKTDSSLTRKEILRGKFNGQVEGRLHIETKNLIATFLELNKRLNNGISEVKIEEIQRSELNYKSWKKPDISSIYINKKLVFEIQLSTTFLNVIIEREIFYKENKAFILWVFRNFEIEADRQRFTQKDIFYSNNRNAFVLDDKAIALSNEISDLVLACNYQVPLIKNNMIVYEWRIEYITLDKLIFDHNSFQVYYFDVSNEEIRLQEILIIKNQEKKIEEEKKNEEEEKGIIEKKLNKLIDSLLVEKYENDTFNSISELLLEQLIFEKKNIDYYYKLNKIDSKSRLIRLLLTKKRDITQDLINLFLNNYIPTKEDMDFLNTEYKYQYTLDQHHSRDSVFYHLILITMFIKLRKYVSYIKDFKKYERILISIYCIKVHRIIGFEYKSLIQVVHPIISDNSRPQFRKVILSAIDIYYGHDKFIVDFDKSKKLQDKINNTTFVDLSVDEKNVFNLIFSELKL